MAKRIVSPAQQSVRTAFKMAVAFLTPLKGVIKKGFAEKARRKKSVASALALGHVLHAAIKITDGQPQVDPSEVILSEGALATIRVEQIERSSDRIEVLHNWFPSDFSAGDDCLTLCAYQLDKGYAFVNQQIWHRQEGKIIVQLPKGFQDDSLHLYLMASDRSGSKYSRSQYLGYSTK